MHYNVRLGWMDTVCINKDSSSELDESIRSMYKWYRGADVCIAYLAETHEVASMNDDSWFRCGWTLQELLAPLYIEFYTTDWEVLGREDEHSLTTIQAKITSATHINAAELVLCRGGETDKLPISRIFKMATSREVTREEDSAYSLMGLLGVDIPTAYGEGAQRALFRLLRELLGTKKHVLDMFNFGGGIWEQPSRTLIPPSIKPYSFRTSIFDSTDSHTASLLDQWQPAEPIILTHMGVRIPLLLVPGLSESYSGTQISEFVPKGSFFGNITVDFVYNSANSLPSYNVSYNYNLLDARIYNAESDSDVSTYRYILRGSIPSVAMFGVINFGVDNEHILLPQRCMSVVLDCGTMKPGEIYPSDSIKMQPVQQQPVFQLKSDEKSPQKIPKCDLEIHGMQLVTLYL